MQNTPEQNRAAARDSLAAGMAVAARFMRIDPAPETYMYHLGISGLLDLYEAAGDARLLDFVLAYYERRAGSQRQFNWHLYTVTGDDKWLAAARDAGEAFLANPRRDRDGALLDPRGRYTIDIISGLVSGPIIFGHVLADHRFFDDAYRQLIIARDYLEDPATGLWYSRWGHNLHPHRPNPGLWGRGNGWLVNAWGRVMHLWDPVHPRYQEVLDLWQHYCRAQVAVQAPSGLFRQLMNRPWSFEEATASGLIGAGIGHGVLQGTLPVAMGAAAYRAAMGLTELVDAAGNVHNVSTTAGGYNFEQQYESCAIFNDAHGDGSVMGACAAAHRLLQTDVPFDRTPPAELPVIVTCAEPGCLSFWTKDMQDSAEVSGPVRQRMQSLSALPELDRQGGTILGLLHWFDASGDRAALAKAQQLSAGAQEQLEEVARLRLAGELARRDNGDTDPRFLAALDGYLAGVPRDREGLILDAHGGYAMERLYHLLPLLGMAGAITGNAVYFNEACTQVLGYREWLEEPISQMWHSAYGRGAHPRRVTPGFWALGHGYLLAGVTDLLDHLPRDHPHYVDVVCLLRDLVKPLHEWLPVWGGWTQILNQRLGFQCVAANGLLCYGIGKAILRNWIKPEYYAAATGGYYFLGKLVGADGAYGRASLPTGGLDSVEAYADHSVENDPYALGFVLSGCAIMQACQATGEPYGVGDLRLGAR